MLLYETAGPRVRRMSLDKALLAPGDLLVGMHEAPPAPLHATASGLRSC